MIKLKHVGFAEPQTCSICKMTGLNEGFARLEPELFVACSLCFYEDIETGKVIVPSPPPTTIITQPSIMMEASQPSGEIAQATPAMEE